MFNNRYIKRLSQEQKGEIDNHIATADTWKNILFDVVKEPDFCYKDM